MRIELCSLKISKVKRSKSAELHLVFAFLDPNFILPLLFARTQSFGLIARHNSNSLFGNGGVRTWYLVGLALLVPLSHVLFEFLLLK